MTDKPNDLLKEQLESGYRVVNAPEAWAYAAENDSGYTPVLGHIGTDVLHTGEFDVVAERDFTGNPEPNRPTDGHGTQVVSQAAAQTGNDLGMAGMSNAKVLVAQIAGGDPRGIVNLRDAFEWLIDHPEGVDVINLSWSFGRAFASELYHALEYARENGVLVVTSAGNDGTNKPDLVYPHQIEMENNLTVAATDRNNDALAEFSNFGDWVEIAAPGVRLPGYVPDRLFRGPDDDPSRDWELVYTWGTSFASPLTAGVALLMCRVNPDLRNRGSVLKDLLMGTAQEMNLTGPVAGKAGAGRVDALAAVKAANDPLAYIGRADD
jgi:subtilisin family serine protease